MDYESQHKLDDIMKLKRLSGRLINQALTIWLLVVLQTMANSQEFERHEGLNLPNSLPEGDWSLSEPAFGNATFTDPIHIVHAPGDRNYIYVLERRGRIIRFHIETHQKNTFLDIRSRVNAAGEGGILGVAFHPNYQINGRFFVFYTTTASNGTGNGYHTRISRFERDVNNRTRANITSERVLISQFNDATNHNGGDIHFGPDGYLYAALGDEGSANDALNNSQRLDKDFFAGIIRLDVDELPTSLDPNPHPAIGGHYKIPHDNPYIGITEFLGGPIDPDEIRTEFWAIGLRNPFRFSFDSTTGLLYAGDVGQNAREEINIITSGGNYGWNFREGLLRGPRFSVNRGFIGPIYEYRHGSGIMEGRSVTGGVVYRGSKHADLFGKYIFGDYVSGNIWALESDGSQRLVRNTENIVRGASRIAAFSHDPSNGDILAVPLTGGSTRIVRLTRRNEPQGDALPEKLSEIGAFTNLESMTPAQGVLAYGLNQPFWSDGSQKYRWIVPRSGSSTINLASNGGFGSFPTRTTWIKHFEIELEEGNPASARKLETRFIVKTSQYVYGATYRWNEDQTDAELVPDEGAEETIKVVKGGREVSQVWRYPSRSECLHCHSKPSGGVLGFNQFQLDRKSIVSDQESKNQLDFFHGIGITRELEKPKTKIVALDDPEASLHEKAVSYIHVNCASCHQPGGPAVGNWDARITTPLWRKGIILGDLVREEDDQEKGIVIPGAFHESALFRRTATRGENQMPPIGSHVVDKAGTDLLKAWIEETVKDWEPPTQDWPTWYLENFGKTASANVDAEDDLDEDNTPDYLEYLLSTNPNDPDSGWTYDYTLQDNQISLQFPSVTQRGFSLIIESAANPDGPWNPVSEILNYHESTKQIVPTNEGESIYVRVTIREPK